jgi:hypothetical protein
MCSDLMARGCAGQKTEQRREAVRLDEVEGRVQNQIVMQIRRLLQIALVAGVALVGLPALARGFNREALPSSAGQTPLRTAPLPSSELPSSERTSPVDSAVPSSPQYGDDDGDGDGDGDGDDGDGSGDDDGSEAQPLCA